MYPELKGQVKEALVAEWKDPERSTMYMHSRDVYRRLVEAGVEVPTGAMEDILLDLKAEGLIVGGQVHDRDYLTHGSFVIQEVDQNLLEAY